MVSELRVLKELYLDNNNIKSVGKVNECRQLRVASFRRNRISEYMLSITVDYQY